MYIGSMPQNHYLVPDQFLGFENNIEHSIHYCNTEDAEDNFVGAKEQLLDVNNWFKHIGPGAGFELVDAHHKTLHRKAHKADHIKMQSSAYAPIFILVEDIEYDDYPDEGRETFAMRLKPGIDQGPQNGNIASNATITIVIDRSLKKLTASYHGRNEATSWLGLSDGQWGSLVKGLVG